MARLKSFPGLSALIACLALLLIWDALARAFAVSGLPPPWGALRQLPSLLSDPETLLNILASLRRMGEMVRWTKTSEPSMALLIISPRHTFPEVMVPQSSLYTPSGVSGELMIREVRPRTSSALPNL